MLRTLLEERFKLKLHRDTKTVQSWVLSVVNSGPRLEPAVETESEKVRAYMNSETWAIVGKGPISALTYYLNSFLGQPVVDMAGLTGAFNVDLKWSDDPRREGKRPDGSEDGTPPFPSAPIDGPTPQMIRGLERLGLRLRLQKVPTTIYVIDSAEKEPFEN